MSKEASLRRILDAGVIAIVRLDSAGQLGQVARAIKAGGVDIIEFTMTTPGALDIIAASTQEFGDEVLLGAGTVLDAETARAAILAGARFIVSPTLNPATVELCHRYSVIAVPGAFSPTEILTAWELGADLVKVVLAPLPQVRLVPTGSVNPQNAADFIRAGAAAVAVGSSLVNKKLVAGGDFDALTKTASGLVAGVRQARGQ
jgi:2-dehydro-3-deoxyphosphogluconate aldolase/(4S)-4-hydroxy-2-oxoglutarate aldolase